VIAIGAILCFLFSIVSAGRLLYFHSRRGRGLASRHEKHIDEMKDWSLKTPLITHERISGSRFSGAYACLRWPMLMRHKEPDREEPCA